MKIRYVGPNPRSVSMLPAGTLRNVVPDELFEIPDKHAKSYTCQPALFKAESAAKPDTKEKN